MTATRSLRDRVAEAMYMRHRTEVSPTWEQMSDGFRRWMLEQADAAMDVIETERMEAEEY